MQLVEGAWVPIGENYHNKLSAAGQFTTPSTLDSIQHF
jgi:hypothetical protein